MAYRNVSMLPTTLSGDDCLLTIGATGAPRPAQSSDMPIVECSVTVIPSRVAGSLLHAIGMPELIARNEDEYFSAALAFATQPGLLHACKAKLRRNRMTTPLFDVAAYTAALESLYGAMWERHRCGVAHTTIGAVAI
ncbi:MULTISPECIES: hypothetical protein [unclassified Bradyrhizobium]|uniref:O-linked N-acetylglucosamine transferase family protein n=1 Tax=unclassified Bradyrhizobium TaxID=2631580 RepID=UPI0028E80015|nr:MULTISPECIES: hypothetical protein [unclassified Bradyrhizobium]